MYDPKSSNDAAFARTLETLCGRKAADKLRAKRGMATFEAKLPTFRKLDDDTLWCLVNAAAASGYPLGFTGNEAYRADR